jgi:hypothetical protein
MTGLDFEVLPDSFQADCAKRSITSGIGRFVAEGILAPLFIANILEAMREVFGLKGEKCAAPGLFG